jgi:predicted transposase/invertase (TIGR01784 family)
VEYAQPNRTFSWYTGVIRERGDTIYQPNDKGYKSLLSSKKVFCELLRSFINRSWVAGLDENDLVKVDKSYVSSDFRGQESDIVYRAKLRKDGAMQPAADREVLFYVLVELQSTVDALMPFRLLGYMVELWRDVLKNAGKSAKRRDFRLPVIVPIVIYNGKRPWTAAQRFNEKLDGAELFGEGVIDFSYLLIDIWRYDERELLAHSNLISAAFLLDRTEEAAEVVARLSQMIDTIRALSDTEADLFWKWTTRILGRRLPRESREQLEAIMEQSGRREANWMITNIEKAIMRTRREERMAGWRKGKQEGKREVAGNLMKMGMSAEQVAEATGLPVEEIRRLPLH